MKIGRHASNQPDRELSTLIAGVQGGWNREHDAEGGHTSISADRITARLSTTTVLDFWSGQRWLKGPWLLNAQNATEGHAIITPTTLAAATDDWAPTNLDRAVVVEVQADAARDLSGLQTALGRQGRLLALCNVGAYAVTLKHNTTSAVVNRFDLPNAADFVLVPGGWVWLFYSVTKARWKALASPDAANLTSGTLPAGRFPPWIPIAYDGAHFTASGSMGWDVASGDQVAYKYQRSGTSLKVGLYLNNTTVTAPLSDALLVLIPGGCTSAGTMGGPISLKDNGAVVEGWWVVGGAGGTTIAIGRLDGANLTASTNATTVIGVPEFEVQ